ncbi:MAG: RNA polymerase sigma factor [Actinomycetota bacterium]|nr:RNA polymerase sigma factor [Actinomycetota bacterium]
MGMNEAERRRRLEALFDEHAGLVRAYARRRIDAASADDAVSEVFAIACRRLEDVPDAALPWLLACARRVLANQRRGEHRVAALRSRLAANSSPALPDGRGDGLLTRALNELAERDREVLLLTAWEGLGPAQAASMLDCSRGTLAVRLHRARRRLEAAPPRLERGEIMTETVEALR